MSVNELWDRLERWMVENTGRSLGLRAGATENDITELEQKTGLALPSDLRGSLLAHDGQEVDETIAFSPCGGFYASVEDIGAKWSDDQDLAEEFPLSTSETQDGDRILDGVFSVKRLPIAGAPYWDGDNTYLDFAPGPKGTPGQVIQLTSECDFAVLASSFSEYLERLIRTLESGALVYNAEKEDLVPNGHEYWEENPGDWLARTWRSSS